MAIKFNNNLNAAVMLITTTTTISSGIINKTYDECHNGTMQGNITANLNTQHSNAEHCQLPFNITAVVGTDFKNFCYGYLKTISLLNA